MLVAWLAPHVRAQDVPAAAVNMVTVVAPGARCMAVSDAHGMLIVGRLAGASEQLSVHRLDDRGRIAQGQPQMLTLPAHAALADIVQYPLDIAFHPTLPVVYVWRDITDPEADDKRKAVYEHFEHLLVYGIENGALKLLGAFGKGADFAFGQPRASIAVSGHGGRIFLTNLRDPANGHAGIGYFDLEDDGMPKAVPVQLEGTLDGRGLEQFDMQHRPARVTVQHLIALPTGNGLFAPTDGAVAFGGQSGPMVWDADNRRASFGVFFIHGMPAYCQIGAHPDVPYIFGAARATNRIFATAHADGYPSMLPHTRAVGSANFRSSPVVMVGGDGPTRIAIGGVHRAYVVAIDTDGRFLDHMEEITLINASVEAITYSTKHDRLYVPVEREG